MNAPVALHVTGTKAVATDQNSIKEAILDFGGVYSEIDGDSLQTSIFYNSTYNAYYDDIKGVPNHSVFICGWDDNFSNLNFNALHRPNYNGAWLFKNSWGPYAPYSQNGYVWISYEDAVLSNFYAVTGYRPANNEKMLSYEDMLIDLYNNFDPIAYICNVYDLSNDYNSYGSISDVMIFAGSIGSTYSVYIEPANTDGSPPAIASLSAPLTTGIESYTGFITVSLPSPYIITQPGKYAIIVKQNTGYNNHCSALLSLKL